jgi:hypothetical protein
VMPPADHAQQLHVDHSDNPSHPAGEVSRHGSFLGGNFDPSRVSSQCKSTSTPSKPVQLREGRQPSVDGYHRAARRHSGSRCAAENRCDGEQMPRNLRR